MPDPDCNRVAYFAAFPNTTHRCTQSEGHDNHCWLFGPETMRPKHRAPVPTDTDPFGIRPIGGRHRLHVGAGSGPNRVDSELRRRLVAARAGSAVVEA